jgi:hypothetical protein
LCKALKERERGETGALRERERREERRELCVRYCILHSPLRQAAAT